MGTLQQKYDTLNIQMETLLNQLEAARTQIGIHQYEISLDKKKISELQETIDMYIQKEQEKIEIFDNIFPKSPQTSHRDSSSDEQIIQKTKEIETNTNNDKDDEIALLRLELNEKNEKIVQLHGVLRNMTVIKAE